MTRERALQYVHQMLDDLGKDSLAAFYRVNHLPGDEIQALADVILTWAKKNGLAQGSAAG